MLSMNFGLKGPKILGFKVRVFYLQKSGGGGGGGGGEIFFRKGGCAS